LRYKFKMKWLWLTTFLLICLLETGLMAFAQTETLTLTLDQAIKMALKADYAVKSDINSLEKNKLAVKKAALDIFPTATVEGQYQYQPADQTYPNSYKITVQETIPTKFNLYGQKIDTDIEAAMWDQVTAEATLQIDAAEVIYDTYNDFLTVLKDQQLLEQYEKAVTEYTTTNDLAKTQLNLGTITKPDQLKIENYLNQAEFNLEKGRSDLEIAMKILANQIGVTDLVNYQLEKIAPESAVTDQELKTLRQKALQRRLELQEDEINIKKSRRIWAQAKNDQLPAVSLSYNNSNESNYFGVSYNFLDGDFSWMGTQNNENQATVTDISGSTTSATNQADRYYTLKLSWSLDFGSKANVAKQAQYDIDNTKLALDKKRTDIGLEVQQTLADYQMAIKQHELDQKALAYYEKDAEIKELQAKLHAITYSDYYDAMQNALVARVSAVKSSYDYVLALQKLKKVTGDLYPFDHQTVLEEKRL
jgi:outer membrane protein TolC